MVRDVYHGLKQYQEVGGDLVERIDKMGLHDVFEPLIEEYSADMEQFNKALFYILNCYSRTSEFVVLEGEWSAIKRQCASNAGVDPDSELFHALFDLANDNVTRTIRKYLDYQGGKAHKHLMMLKDLYDQMVNSAIENIKDGNENTNYDQKKKNAEHASKLYSEINEWEQKIEVTNTPLKKATDEFVAQEKKNKTKFSLRMEDNRDIQ